MTDVLTTRPEITFHGGTTSSLPSEYLPSPKGGAEVSALGLNREAALRRLLGTDYEFAHQQGLTDIFTLDPEKGQDGLMHVLTGHKAFDAAGMTTVEGFHHEPSSLHVHTRALTDHLEGANNAYRRQYRQFPFEPYNAQVAIEGYEKRRAEQTDSGAESKRVANSMFPKEYDTLAVLQAIKQAYGNREPDGLVAENGNIVTTGTAKMLDGTTDMKIRLILDSESGKIITAMPISKTGSVLKLSQTAIRQHLGL